MLEFSRLPNCRRVKLRFSGKNHTHFNLLGPPPIKDFFRKYQSPHFIDTPPNYHHCHHHHHHHQKQNDLLFVYAWIGIHSNLVFKYISFPKNFNIVIFLGFSIVILHLNNNTIVVKKLEKIIFQNILNP